MPTNMVWPERKLSEICDLIQYGYTAKASVDEVGPRYLRITDIVPDLIDWDAVPYCEMSPSDADKYRLIEGDIVVARTGATVGYAKYVSNPPPSVFASYLVRLRVSADYDARYVGQVVESKTYKRFVLAHAGGAAQPNANAKILTSFPILVPPLPIQRKIGGVLSAYDDLIANNTRRIAILEDTARTIYREWFVDFRYPGHEGVPLVDSELGPIPEGWCVIELQDQCHVVMGQSPKSEFYNEHGDGLPFHQGVTGFGRWYPNHSKYCTVLKRTAEEGDALVSVRAPVGRINVADEKLVIGRGLAAVRSKRNQPTLTILQLKKAFEVEDAMGGGTIFKAITKSDLTELPWLKPHDTIAELFEEMVGPMLRLIENLVRANRRLQSTRDLLLPRLISGEVDVSGLDIDLGVVA